MKRNERMLLGITATALVLYLADQGGAIDAVTGVFSGDGGETAALIEQNKQFVSNLKNISEIEEEFERIGSLFQDVGASANQRFWFVDQLVTICKKISQPNPRIDPPDYEEIPDVTEFQYVTVQITMNGLTDKQFTEFMRELERQRILVMSLEVTSTQDQDRLQVNAKLAKIERTAQAASSEDTPESAATPAASTPPSVSAGTSSETTFAPAPVASSIAAETTFRPGP